MNQVKIILVDWIGYPLQRRRRMGRNKHICGLGPLLKNLQTYEPGIGYDLMLIINSVLQESKPIFRQFPALIKRRQRQIKRRKARYLKLKQQYQIISTLIFRESNLGKDIGAYDFGFNELKKEGYTGDVVMMNTNIRGPSENDWLINYYKLFRKHQNTGLCGVSLNSHDTTQTPPVFDPHVQSFFIYSTMEVLKKAFPNILPGADFDVEKDKLIQTGEIGISRTILDMGYGIVASMFPEFHYKKEQEWSLQEGDLRQLKQFDKRANKL